MAATVPMTTMITPRDRGAVTGGAVRAATTRGSANTTSAESSAPYLAPGHKSTAPSTVDLRSLPTSTGRPRWLVPLLGVAALIVVAGIAWYALAARGSSGAYDQGVVAYREGRREAAEGAFHKAALDQPNDPMPHVYLARMERERGNLNNANAEAVKAVQLGPTNDAALRELASALFAQQNYDGARTFYTRAVQSDSSDRVAQGFLGCSLVRLGRVTEGRRWLDRAGSGAWSTCTPSPIGSVPAYSAPGLRRP